MTWNIRLRWEWKLRDSWIGVFWKWGELNSDIWIILPPFGLPCLPLHITLRRARCPRCGAVCKRTYTDTGGIEGCCIECCWNPDGCQCRFGNYGKQGHGVAGTYGTYQMPLEDEDC